MADECKRNHANGLENAVVDDQGATNGTAELRGHTEALSYYGQYDDEHANEGKEAGFGELGGHVSLDIVASGLGQRTFAMSLYKERGYETPRMHMMIMARRSVSSQRKDMSCKEGNTAEMT